MPILSCAALDDDLEPLDHLGIALGADRRRAADRDDDVGRALKCDPVERADLEVRAARSAAISSALPAACRRRRASPSR